MALAARSRDARDVLIERYGDDAFQAVFSKLQLDIAAQIGGQRPFKQEASEPAAFGRAHGWTAALPPANPQLLVLGIHLPRDIDRAAFPR